MRADSAMPAKAPKVIYRYQPMRPDSIDLIQTGRLWFSNPSRFNDPFDFLPDFSNKPKALADKDREEAYWTNPSIRGSREGFLRATEHRRHKFVRDYCRMLHSSYKKDLAKSFWVACFSQTHDSILMWSHYAWYHSGLCIGIRPAKMRLSPEMALRWKVDYRDERLPIEHPKPNEIALRKARAWKHEREWRVVMATKDLTRGARPLPPQDGKDQSEPGFFLQLDWDAIESVRFGAMVDRKQRSALLKAFRANKRRHMKVIQMHLSSDKFELEPEVLREGS